MANPNLLMSLNMELGRDVYSWLWGAGLSQFHHLKDSKGKQMQATMCPLHP